MIAEQAGQPGVAELLRQVRRGGLAIVFCSSRTDPLDIADLDQAPCPVVVVVGDDDYASTGPAGWRAASTLAAWARAAVVHAAGATADTYRQAADAARIVGHSVLVETDSAHALEWAAIFHEQPVLTVFATDGQHPALRRSGWVQ